MKLNQTGNFFLALAEEKGWGHTKEMLVVSEKMMLINTEITELHDAMLKKPINPKDTVESETADILGRVLHLGLVWGVDFDRKVPVKSRFGKQMDGISDADYLYLHTLVSRGYEAYRHKKITLFKKYLYEIAHETVLLAGSMNIDIESAVIKKLEINKARSWSRKGLNGKYYKEK
jgi:NTP pyrophosphatase (non-canonical NTP hydrolase)